MMASATDKVFWKDFIVLYRSYPELWNIKSDNYKNNNLKREAYKVLLNKMKEMKQDATIDYMKKKINILRTSFRRELKKIKASEKSGAGSADIYSPTLWYFEDLVFLKDQEIALEGRSTMESDDDCEEIIDRSAKLRNNKKGKRKANNSEEESRNELLQKAVEHLSNANDEAEILAKSWAVKYRKLSQSQQIFAIKAIDDVFSLGFMEKLRSCSSQQYVRGPLSRTYNYSTSTPYTQESTSYSSNDSSFSPYSASSAIVMPATDQPQFIRVIHDQVIEQAKLLTDENAESDITLSENNNEIYTNINSLLNDTQFC